ncbi:MAG: hypothetical protein GVY30_07000 [Chloroflexi bacterium]|jgi:hypothetical protein|nr:hypothetical protein [Chloroflexota bacterium]
MEHGWAFSDKSWYFSSFKNSLSQASAEMTMARGEDAAGSERGGMDPSLNGYLIGGGATAVVATIRQFVPGFWFHPIGVLLAPNWMCTIMWGSCLVAWILRLSVLKLGGAMAVREKLQPFFVGAFVGAVVGHFLHVTYAAIWIVPAGEPIFRWGVYNLP